jgi:hypothetical protein
MELSRHVIRANDQDLQQVLTSISSLQDLVVVSISSSAAPESTAFSLDILQALLSGSPDHLYIETLPKDKYVEWTADHLARRVASAGVLCSLLRNNRVTDLSTQVRSFLAEMEELLRLLTSAVGQAATKAVTGQVEDLDHAIAQLSDSCFKYEDNVRSMDCLHYEILPLLKKLQKIF